MPYYGNIGQRNQIEAQLNYDYEINIAGNTTALIDHLNLVLCAGRYPPRTELQSRQLSPVLI